ncbi:MAG: thioredoxin family protein [Pseudaminobacter sp.]|nr:thioredoxin family protein [Pseudaminobacter sp.]
MRTRFILPLAAALALPGAGAALAGDAARPVGVVELFTSQGCSSCPPADALFGEMAAKGDVVALAYHVDYWDYLGWRDTLGSAENTARQHGYGKSFGIRSVYTPQAVINGRTHVNGAVRSEVSGALEGMEGSAEGLTVGVTVTRSGESVMIDAGAATGKMKDAHVVLVYFEPAQPVVIERGENTGSTVTYWNAVSDIQTAGMWHGQPKRFELPASEIAKKGGCAVLLQSVGKDGLPGPILGAAVIRDPAN